MQTPDRPKHRHRAEAAARVRFESPAREDLDYGSTLAASETGALIAARRAEEFLPRVADAELTEITVDYEWRGERVLAVSVFVEGFSRDGLGTRALLAANVCATAVADAVETESAELEHSGVTMERGGSESLEYDFNPSVRVAVLSISDAVASGDKDDRAGGAVRRAIEHLEAHGVELAADEILPDDRDRIRTVVRQLCDEVDFIVTVGGTGLTHSDSTIEAIEPLLDRRVPGLSEAMRDYGWEQTPLAFMSRGIAGLCGDTLVVAFPGSTSGAEEATEAIFPAVLHVFRTLRKSNNLLDEE